jgi:peptide chain release factor 1
VRSPLAAKLESLAVRYQEVTQLLGDPDIVRNIARYQVLAKEHKELTPVVETWNRLQSVERQIEDNQELTKDPDEEIREMAREEIAPLETEKTALNERLKVLLIPKDPLDERNVILEIRAGTGGDEAALFAANLFRMYSRFAESRRWKVEIMSCSEIAIGGFKEIIANVSGPRVFSYLRYESGVHRVQRVPETESQGRIHTSTVTVAVLPEADEVDVTIEDKDLKVDVYRSSGPGGQSVNTTDSAVRVTHIPTGLIVTCQDEKSQHKNKAKALKVLRARLLEAEIQKVHSERAASRRAQVGTGERSERIRTYNFPENRITDHRIGLTIHRLDVILQGALEYLTEPLRENARAEALQSEDS